MVDYVRSPEEDDDLGITDMDAPEPSSSDEEEGDGSEAGHKPAAEQTVPTMDEAAAARGAVGSVNASAARAATMRKHN